MRDATLYQGHNIEVETVSQIAETTPELCAAVCNTIWYDSQLLYPYTKFYYLTTFDSTEKRETERLITIHMASARLFLPFMA